AWSRLAAHDPYSSRYAIGLMVALAAAGNRAAALRHARIHAQLLEQEFGTKPDPEVVALAQHPSYSVGHQWYANHLVAMGRFDEAAREMSRAREVNPLSLIANGALG
ncbi:MAG: BTAD domain-containing putative transcriptional regulator, partial [Vicinamibacteraceae bacterium]